jgi:hypothetical protein
LSARTTANTCQHKLLLVNLPLAAGKRLSGTLCLNCAGLLLKASWLKGLITVHASQPQLHRCTALLSKQCCATVLLVKHNITLVSLTSQPNVTVSVYPLC